LFNGIVNLPFEAASFMESGSRPIRSASSNAPPCRTGKERRLPQRDRVFGAVSEPCFSLGLPTVEAMSPAEIAGVLARSGISRAIPAAYLNVAAGAVSQWERGERHPTDAALKLLNIVKQNGIDALR
jgi:hypothetical protein